MKNLIAAFAATCIIGASAFAASTGTSQSERATTSTRAVGNNSLEGARLRTELLNGLKPAEDIGPRLAKIKTAVEALGGRNATKRSQTASLNAGLIEIAVLDRSLARLRTGFEAAERRIGAYGGLQSVDDARTIINELRTAFEAGLKDLENGDKISDKIKFKMGDVSSKYKRSEVAISKVLKETEETSRKLHLRKWQ